MLASLGLAVVFTSCLQDRAGWPTDIVSPEMETSWQTTVANDLVDSFAFSIGMDVEMCPAASRPEVDYVLNLVRERPGRDTRARAAFHRAVRAWMAGEGIGMVHGTSDIAARKELRGAAAAFADAASAFRSCHEAEASEVSALGAAVVERMVDARVAMTSLADLAARPATFWIRARARLHLACLQAECGRIAEAKRNLNQVLRDRRLSGWWMVKTAASNLDDIRLGRIADLRDPKDAWTGG